MAAIPRLHDIALVALIAASCACLSPAHAARLPANGAGAERPRVEVTRTDERVRVDGVLDEPAWAAAHPISGLRLAFVNEGGVPCESTTVRVLLEDDAIVFGIEVTNRSPGAIRASLAPRDGILDGAWLGKDRGDLQAHRQFTARPIVDRASARYDRETALVLPSGAFRQAVTLLDLEEEELACDAGKGEEEQEKDQDDAAPHIGHVYSL